MFKSLDTSIAHIYYLESNFRLRFRFYSQPVQINRGKQEREAFNLTERFGKNTLGSYIYQTMKIIVAQLFSVVFILFFCDLL